ncbi:MAG: YcbK family protein [Pelagibaca sp.]
MSHMIFTRRQALAALAAATGFAAPARAGLIVGASGPLIGRAPGPVVSLDRPQRAPQPLPQDKTVREPIAAAPPRLDGVVSVALLNAHTGDRITALFDPAGQSVSAQEKARLDWFFRDWRQNEIRPMDPETLAILATLVGSARRKGWDGEVRVNSGYRSRKTNDQLRRRGIGAARNSLHLQARAIDFSFPGFEMKTLHRLAETQASGGVGLYRSFVHIDSGTSRRWWG